VALKVFPSFIAIKFIDLFAMASPSKLPFDNAQDFTAAVESALKEEGWILEPSNNPKAYDCIARKDGQNVAVLIKWYKSPVSSQPINKFESFLSETEEGKEFDRGFIITNIGYSKPALATIKGWGEDRTLTCCLCQGNTIHWGPEIEDDDGDKITDPQKKIYIGVFTCKGGVGKTTVAAHLAGALLLQNYDVALIDIDPEQNLHRLMGDGVFLPNPGKMGNSINVFNAENWGEEMAEDCQVIICDCSPALERNPPELIQRLDYCIIPTTLNPLGINKHGSVIRKTVDAIRKTNTSAHLFVVVNNFRKIGDRYYNILRTTLLDTYKEISQKDPKFECIDPSLLNIRSSDQLYHWGVHLLEDQDIPRSKLAFDLIGGRSNPRNDFIQLSEYIIENTSLKKL
jgi:cellulose biosynthesis protein BcsQ